MQVSRRNELVLKPPPKQRSLVWMKTNQAAVLHGRWIVKETVSAHESETIVATDAQTLHAEAIVGLVFEIDVIEAAPESDRIEPAHELVPVETNVRLEAALVPNTITTSEADLGDANAVVPDLEWLIDVREVDRESGQTEGTEVETEEIVHARDCALIDGIEPALALDVTEVVLAITGSAELITTIHEKEIGIETAPETVRGTKDLPHDDEAETGLGMIVLKKSLERRNPTKPPRRNARRKRRNHLTAEVLLEPQPLLRDLVLARLRTSLRSGSKKRSRSGRRRLRHIWRLRRTPGTKACQSQDSTTKRVVARFPLTCAAVESTMTLIGTCLEAARSVELVELGVVAVSAKYLRIGIVNGTGETEIEIGIVIS